MATREADADGDVDADQSAGEIVAQLATESANGSPFDARKIRSQQTGQEAVAHLDGYRPVRPAALDDKYRLAELYYGGCPEAPDGLSQAQVAAYLGVSPTTVSTAMADVGIRPPQSYRNQRSGSPSPPRTPPAHLPVDATGATRPARNQPHRDGGDDV